MKVYKILVPHNEIFQFWVDDDKLWHIKDYNHTHPQYNTRCKKHHKTMLTWDRENNSTLRSTAYNPTTMLCSGIYSIDYEEDAIKEFVRFTIDSMNERSDDYLKPKCEGGMGHHPIFAYRVFGGNMEISFFVHPNITDKVWDWVM